MRSLSVLDHRGNPIPVTALIPRSVSYEGAASGRRMGLWGTWTSGPNASLFQSLNRLRSRSRELIRNNPLIDGGADSYVANIIGSGIFPRWQLDDPDLKKSIQDLWSDWVEEADYAGLCDFYGLQSLACRALIDAGEVLVRLVPTRMGEGNPVPLQIHVLEADHLDETHTTVAPNGNEIRMGIEIDPDGRRAAYWLFREHPGESFISSGNTTERVRIPADEVLHVFQPVRPGQMRGRPWLSSIIVKLHELDQYDDAEVVRKKTAAMFGGFITEGIGVNDPSAYFGARSGDAPREIVALEPGTFPVLPAGMDVRFSEPADVGGTYEAWMRSQLRQIAKGMGLTYEQLTGDLTGVNYSSIRAGLLEFRRRVEHLQIQILAFQLCRPVAHAWLDTAINAGALRIPDYCRNRRRYLRIRWRPDGWPWVDPVKDQMAEQMAVRNGFKSRSQVIAERGGDVDTVDREIFEDNRRADALGLVYDSDPRKTAKSGAAQQTEGDEANEPAEGNEP